MEIVKRIKLFECNVKASDGSIIPREIVEAYLKSETNAKVNRDNLMLGGLTHKDRYGDKTKKGTGVDDPMILNRNTTHRINDLELVGDWVCAKLTVFDPDLFTGEVKQNIEYLQGLINSGVALPGSVVIDGDWSKKGVLLVLKLIVGWDVTLNPAYKGAGMED